MADKKISELSAKTTVVLADLIPIVDSETNPLTNKKVTLANLLVSLGIRQGETGSQTVTTAGYAVVFAKTLFADVNGKDYELVINCFTDENHTEQVGYILDNRSNLGFEIFPLATAYVEWTAILID